MTQEELYKSLYDITIDEILKHHCNINESAKQKLYEIVKYGVGRMSVNDRYNGERIALAQKMLNKWQHLYAIKSKVMDKVVEYREEL